MCPQSTSPSTVRSQHPPPPPRANAFPDVHAARGARRCQLWAFECAAARVLAGHDTYGQALANILIALQHGVATVDASTAGLGGCPFAGPGAAGNVATEDVVYMLHGLGLATGVDFDRVVDAGEWVVGQLGRANASKAALASLRRRASAPCSPVGYPDSTDPLQSHA